MTVHSVRLIIYQKKQQLLSPEARSWAARAGGTVIQDRRYGLSITVQIITTSTPLRQLSWAARHAWSVFHGLRPLWLGPRTPEALRSKNKHNPNLSPTLTASLSLSSLLGVESKEKHGVWEVHPRNVRFQNVRFQNVWLQNVGFQNVRFTKRQVYKTSGFKASGFKTSSF